MESIPVRLLITRSGTETSQEVSVISQQSLAPLNEEYFPDIDTASTQIKWIYCGRALSGQLPDVVTPNSVFHVYDYYYRLFLLP